MSVIDHILVLLYKTMKLSCYITSVAKCDRTVIQESCRMIFQSVEQVRRLYRQEQGIGCGNGRFVQTNIVAKGCGDTLDSFRYFGVAWMGDRAWNHEGFFARYHRPQGLSVAYFYRSAPVPVNMQLHVEFEDVSKEEAI